MRAWRLLFVAGWLLTACGGATPTGVAPTGIEPQPTGSAASSAAPATAAASPIPTVVPLTILAPQDEAVVNVPEIEVVGQTAPNAVISLNDEIAVADAGGHFTAIIPLVEGPNHIEIVVSDADGNTVNFELTVTYDPES